MGEDFVSPQKGDVETIGGSFINQKKKLNYASIVKQS